MNDLNAITKVINENGNNHILLGVFPAEIVKGACRFHADCSVYYIIGNKLDLSIEFYISSETGREKLLFTFEIAPVTIKIPGKELITGDIKNLRGDLVTIQPNRMCIKDENTQALRLQSAELQLINFRFTGFGGPRLPGVNGYQLNIGDWVIKITNIPEIKDKFQELASTEGYGITHDVELYKSDNSNFGVSDLDELISVLHTGLSFANGGWISLHDLKGLNNEGSVVYQYWGVNLCESWQSRIKWLEENDIKALGMFLNCFYNRYHDKERLDTLQKAIYWYVRSNRSSSGHDGGMILSVSALERLSNHVIEANELSSGKELRRLSVKLRLAVDYFGIPLGIDDNSGLADLRDYLESSAKDNDEPSDIALAIVAIRNDLVHPKRNVDRVIFRASLFPAWNTAQWLIEMLVLRLIGYSGVYVDRQVLGGAQKVRSVPWQNASGKKEKGVEE